MRRPRAQLDLRRDLTPDAKAPAQRDELERPVAKADHGVRFAHARIIDRHRRLARSTDESTGGDGEALVAPEMSEGGSDLRHGREDPSTVARPAQETNEVLLMCKF